MTNSSNSTGSSLTLSAILAVMPLSIAVIPWGVLTGALAIQAGFSPLQAQALSLFVFAGAAQISGISMVGAGVPLSSLFGSTVVISARHLLYSIIFRAHVEKFGFFTRVVVAFVLTDEMFVVSEALTKKTGSFSLKFALVSGFTFYLAWNLATLAGVVAGQSLQNLDALGLDFAIVATFIAMTFDQLRARPEIATVVVSGVLAVALQPVFEESYIIIATLVGMLTGYYLSADSDDEQGQLAEVAK